MIDKDYRESYRGLFREALIMSVEGFYDEAALPSYTHHNRLMSWLFWKRIDVALSMAGSVKDDFILDFGCGGGVTFKYLSSKGAKIFACDNQFDHLAEFVSDRLKAGATIFRTLSDIEGIRFDKIFALDVLEHVEDLDQILNMITRLSHDRTCLIVSGPTENLLYKIGRLFAGFSGHYHKRNIYDIADSLCREGFKRMKIKRLFYPLTFFRISSWRVPNGQA